MNFTNDIILENVFVKLRPLQSQDTATLASIALDEEIWRYTVNSISNEPQLQQYVEGAVAARSKQERYPFIIIDKVSGKVAGSTSFGNISSKDKRLEIGWTWLGSEFQGKGINLQCKWLLLKYAFEELQFERVEFKSDINNKKSCKALQKIGAVQEGVLRSHTLMHAGNRRETVYFSVLRSEWERVKISISSCMHKHQPV